MHASRQNLTKSLCNLNKRMKLISCFKLEYRLSVSVNIGPKISVIGISVNFHIGASLVGSKVKLALFVRNESDITGT